MALQPLVCIGACGMHLGDSFMRWRELVQRGYTRDEALAYLAVDRQCCRTTVLTFYPHTETFCEIVQNQHDMHRLATGISDKRPTFHESGTNFNMFRDKPQRLDHLDAPYEPAARVRARTLARLAPFLAGDAMAADAPADRAAAEPVFCEEDAVDDAAA